MNLRLVTPSHPAAVPLLAGLRREYTDVAGGALRRLGPGVGEIKGLWTAPAHRGRGYGRRVLQALEAAAVRRGYHTLRLETGRLELDGPYDLATDELDLREILVREMLKHHPLDAGLRQAA